MDQYDQFPEPTTIGQWIIAEGCTTVGNYYRAECVAIALDDLKPGDVVMTSRGEFWQFNRIYTGHYQTGKYSFSSEHPTGVGYHPDFARERMPALLWRKETIEERPRPDTFVGREQSS